MSQKKINGYVIFLKEVLGKGSYGSVSELLGRSFGDSRTIPRWSAQSRFLKKS
jgi:hypothetical protein